MVEKIKEGYNLFIKKDEEKMIGTLTLNDDDIYKDIIELKNENMLFLNEFPNISGVLCNNKALFITYNNEKERFVSSIKEKINIGEYNDQVIWSDTLSNFGQDIFESLNNLNNHIIDEVERSYGR